MTSELTDLFDPFPSLNLSKANKALYKSFSYTEPQLVSLADNSTENCEQEVLVLHENEPLGMVSVVIQDNNRKASLPNKYARLDLVIVDKKYRNLGIGRLLMVCSLVYLLRTRSKQLYSISCLAAHQSVEKNLKQLSFTGSEKKEKNFWQGSIDLESKNPESLLEYYLKFSKNCLQWTAYKLNQKIKQA